MPCFDKKLEAARDDFYNEVFSTREVDCVITSGMCAEVKGLKCVCVCMCVCVCVKL